MGVFNMSTQTRVECVPLPEFLHVEVEDGGRQYALRSHVTGKIVAPLTGQSSRSLVKLELGHRGYDVLTLYPLLPMGGGSKVAVLGLLEKMSGAAAVTGVGVDFDGKIGGKAIVSTELKALGSFGLFVTRQDEGEDILNVATSTLCGESIPDAYLHVEHLKNGFLLRLDLEGAWEELALEDQPVVVVVAV
jgi:hypothetical protein